MTAEVLSLGSPHCSPQPGQAAGPRQATLQTFSSSETSGSQRLAQLFQNRSVQCVGVGMFRHRAGGHPPGALGSEIVQCALGVADRVSEFTRKIITGGMEDSLFSFSFENYF